MNKIWRTCTHCNNKFEIELKDKETDYDRVTTFCPFCNMNKAGDEKQNKKAGGSK